MDKKVTIRFATKEDAGLIADLSRKTFFDAFAPFNTKADMEKFMNEQFSKKKLMEEVNDEKNIFLLAYIDQKVLGYTKMSQSPNPEELSDVRAIEIARIYVADQLIGKGVGSAMMDWCLSHAKALKKDIIWLGVWENNRRAIDFYSKWGFEKFGEHSFILGNDVQNDWLMKKSLTETISSNRDLRPG
jgi:diamine N-acetyltransferase